MYGWPDLPPDLLREISGHLCSVPDYVRFHAVCSAWRSSHDPARAQSFLPWLVARSTNRDDPLNLRCIFSKRSYVAPMSSSDSWRNWVCGADGGTIRYVTDDRWRPMLHDPLVTGGVTAVEAYFPFPKDQWMDSPGGVVYRDGTILLYKKNYPSTDTDMGVLKAMILRPGDTAWTVVERTLEYRYFDECPVAYHGGKIFFTQGGSLWQWHAVIPGCNDNNVDVVIPTPTSVEEDDYHRYWYEDSYLVESNGELLWLKVSVRDLLGLLTGLSVLVYVLEEAPDKKMRWKRKSGQSLADRVFFLGRSNSFAVDASQLDSSRDGGCTYFTCYNYDESDRQRRWCIIRYNLANGRAKIIEWLPQSWQHERCAWLVLHPTIAPIQEIRERLQEASEWKRLQQVVAAVTPRSIIDHNVRPLQPCFRILVSNLPLTVNSTQLSHFFSKHGEVYSTKIICYEKTRTSQGKGLVTMATVHVRRADALATLNNLVWDENNLNVREVSEQWRRRPSPTPAAQLHIARPS